MTTFALNLRHDPDELAEEFARTGVLSIAPILDEASAAELHNLLRARDDWVQVINSGEKLVELDRATRSNLTERQREELDKAVYAGARYDFQYRYETIRVPDNDDERRKSSDMLAKFARWWSSGEPREFLRTVTRCPHIQFADAQATAYSPGDFLTGHDDDVAGKGREAAYVLGLTPKWRLEWGGLLAFHLGNEDASRALVPGFNRLNIFRVPQRHSVTEVTRSAANRRYSITGWLRR